MQRAKRKRTEFSYDFDLPVEKIWEFISNTDRFNRAVGLSQVQYTYKNNLAGGTHRYGMMKLGGLSVRWLEKPYEWVQFKKFGVERIYSSGPIRWASFYWEFEKTAPGKCRVKQVIEYEASHSFLTPLISLKLGQKNSVKTFSLFYDRLQKKIKQNASPEIYPAIVEDHFQPSRKVLKNLKDRIEQTGVSIEILDRFYKLITQGQSPELVRIRPFSLAEQWKINRIELLNAFLVTTRAGIFDLSWDVICPSCTGAKARVSELAFLRTKSHCEQCDIKFNAELDRSVELSFTVNPTIRRAQYAEFCAGSPQNTQHRLFQFRLAPGEKKEIEFDFEKSGLYFLRSLQSKAKFRLQVGLENAKTMGSALVFNFDADQSKEVAVSTGQSKITLLNSHPHEIYVGLEWAHWMENACTAALVTSLQIFKDLFSSEVLAMGQEVYVSSIALLFTDLKNSTSLYQEIGDARAFALVQKHIEELTDFVRTYEGAVVKTIGDSVMASFIHPENALKAAIEIQKRFSSEQLEVRIGLNYGPCFAVTMNDRIDYFGSTVNLASRAEGQCDAHEIVITEAMMNLPKVKKTLLEAGLQANSMIRKLKGFREDFQLFAIGVRSVKMKKSDVA